MIYGRLVALRHRGQVAVLALIALLFLAHVVGLATVDRTITNGQIIAGDGLLYYEYLPFVILDGHLKEPYERGKLRDAKQRAEPDRQSNACRLGALNVTFFSDRARPFIGFGDHGRSSAVRIFGLIDQFVTNLGAVVYGLFGIYLCYRSLREFFDEAISGAAVVAFVLCSNLPYYIVVYTPRCRMPFRSSVWHGARLPLLSLLEMEAPLHYSVSPLVSLCWLARNLPPL